MYIYIYIIYRCLKPSTLQLTNFVVKIGHFATDMWSFLHRMMHQPSTKVTVAPQSWMKMLMGRLESQLDGSYTTGVFSPSSWECLPLFLIVTSWV